MHPEKCSGLLPRRLSLTHKEANDLWEHPQTTAQDRQPYDQRGYVTTTAGLKLDEQGVLSKLI